MTETAACHGRRGVGFVDKQGGACGVVASIASSEVEKRRILGAGGVIAHY